MHIAIEYYLIYSGELRFTHWGDIVDGVDERGEVALLSRNIVIQGEMTSSCTETNGNCAKFPYDTFGGHIKVNT